MDQLLGVLPHTCRPAFESQLIHKLNVSRGKYLSVYELANVKSPQMMNCDAVCRVLQQSSELLPSSF